MIVPKEIIGIVGSRNWPRLRVVWGYVEDLDADTEVVSGGAAGVDSAVRECMQVLGREALLTELKVTDADRAKYGPKSAYHVRNGWIVASIDRLVAFQYYDANDHPTAGTHDAIVQAITADKPVIVYEIYERLRRAGDQRILISLPAAGTRSLGKDAAQDEDSRPLA